MQNKLDQLRQLEKDLGVAKEKAYEKVNLILNSIDEKILEIFDFKHKFIKITSYYDSSLYTYMWCDEVKQFTDLSGNSEIMFRGYGFCSEITQYRDATWFTWDEMKDMSFKVSPSTGYIDILKNITVITENEFNTVFNDAIMKLLKRHESNIEDIKLGKGI